VPFASVIWVITRHLSLFSQERIKPCVVTPVELLLPLSSSSKIPQPFNHFPKNSEKLCVKDITVFSGIIHLLGKSLLETGPKRAAEIEPARSLLLYFNFKTKHLINMIHLQSTVPKKMVNDPVNDPQPWDKLCRDYWGKQGI